MPLSPIISPIVRRNARLDALSAILNALPYAFVYQFYIPVAIQHGAGSFQVGLMAAAPAIGSLLSPLAAGRVDASQPKPWVVIPSLVGRLLLILPALTALPVIYVLALIGFHFMLGMQGPANAALVTRMYPSAIRGRMLGRSRMFLSLSMIPLSLLVGFWLQAEAASSLLLLSAVCGIASTLVIARADMNGDAESPSSMPKTAAAGGTLYTNKQALAKRTPLADCWTFIRNNRKLMLFFVATSFCGFGNILASPLYAMIQIHQLQLSSLEISYARIVYFIMLLLAYGIGGWIIDRFSPEIALAGGMACFALVPLLYLLFPHYNGVLAASAINGIADAIWEIGILTFIFRIAPGREAVVFSFHQMLFGIRGTIAPLIGTSLGAALSFTPILLGSCISASMGGLVISTILRERKKRRTPVATPTG